MSGDAASSSVEAGPRMISGKWVILVVAGLGLLGSGFGWLWLYDAQRKPRDFWGYGTWRLVGRAPHVEAISLQPEPEAPAEKPHPIWYDGLVVVQLDPRDAERYVIAERKPVDRAAGISLPDQSSSLREALGHHRSYNWESMAAVVQKPVWRYALKFSDAAPATPSTTTSATPSGTSTAANDTTFVPTPQTATLLFDAECKFVRPQSVDKPVSLQPSISEQFQKFFLTEFPPPAPKAE